MDSLRAAAFSIIPSFAAGKRRMTAARRAGLAFEKRVRKELNCDEPEWILYHDRAGEHYAHPDILSHPMMDGSILLLEVKLKLTRKAIFRAREQMNERYIPLAKFLFDGRRIRTGIVGKFLDGTQAHAFSDVVLTDLNSSPALFHWDGYPLDSSLRRPIPPRST